MNSQEPPVTSHVEVWIETRREMLITVGAGVTAHVEVWIETPALWRISLSDASPPTWRCGLKLNLKLTIMKTKEVTSHVEVWIETVDTTKIKPAEQGHLPRGGVD